MIQTSLGELVSLLQTDFFLHGMAMSSDGHAMGEFAGPINNVMAANGEALIVIGPSYHRATAQWMKHSTGKVLGALETPSVSDIMRDTNGGVSFWVGKTQYWLYPKNHPTGEELWDKVACDLLCPALDVDNYGLSDKSLDPHFHWTLEDTDPPGNFPCGE